MENGKRERPEIELIISETTPPGEYIPKEYVMQLLKIYSIKMEGLVNLIKDGKEYYAHNKAQGIKDHMAAQLRYLEPPTIQSNENNKDI